MHKNVKDNILPILYVFFAIFNPPLLPFSTIYLIGLFSIVYYLSNRKFAEQINVIKKTKINKIIVPFIIIAAISLIISAIDTIFIDGRLFLDDRMKVISRITLITILELFFAINVIIMAKKRNKGLEYILKLLLAAGMIEGVFVLCAYIFPELRALFLSTSNLSDNTYYLERRGYGFSSTLLDTFGYGMGLLAGLLILYKSKKKNILVNVIILALLVLSITLNARTGLIVLALSVIIYIFRLEKASSIFKTVVGLTLLVIFFVKILPNGISNLEKSGSINQRWIASSLSQIYDLAEGKSDASDMAFLSDFSHLPESKFELVFGTGHSSYGLREELGFHSDIGYINLIWQYGIIGAVIVLAVMMRYFILAYKSASNRAEKSLVIFVMMSFYITNIKAILIGVNPGIIITYIIAVSIMYYGKEDYEKEREISSQYNSTSV